MRCAIVAICLFALWSSVRLAKADDDDPVIGETKLSKLIEQFNAAKSADERSRLAFVIAEGKDKAKAAVPVLAAALKDKDRVVRVNVAGALAMMGPSAKAAVPELVNALKDTEAMVRISASSALAAIGPEAKAAVPALKDLFQDTTQTAELRAGCARALGAIGADEKAVVPLLTDALKDKNGHIRVAAASALYGYDKANAKLALPVFRDALKDADEFVQTGAIDGLKTMGVDAKAAIPDLVALLKNGGMGAYYAGEAIAKMGPEGLAALLNTAKGSDVKAKAAAIRVLRLAYPDEAKKAGF